MASPPSASTSCRRPWPGKDDIPQPRRGDRRLRPPDEVISARDSSLTTARHLGSNNPSPMGRACSCARRRYQPGRFDIGPGVGLRATVGPVSAFIPNDAARAFVGWVDWRELMGSRPGDHRSRAAWVRGRPHAFGYPSACPNTASPVDWTSRRPREGHGAARLMRRRNRFRKVRVPAHVDSGHGHGASARSPEPGAGRFQGRRDLSRARAGPHVAAVITNLADEAHLVARMQDALAGEMNRRQELLRAAGNSRTWRDY